MCGNISSKELKTMMESGIKVILVDVRSKEEYMMGHINGAINLPLGEVNVDKIYDLCDLENDKRENIVVLICRSGTRSLHCQESIRLEYSYDDGLNVKFLNLGRGMLEWEALGYEMVH